MKNASKHQTAGWLALGAVALGILLTGIGLWTLGWRPQSQPAAAAVNEPTATRIVAVLPTATMPPPTATPTEPPPTATATRTPGAPTPFPTASQVPGPSESLELAIVHSNDTWGYSRPCG